MAHEYLTPESPDSFIDFPPPAVPQDGKILCAKCKGYGGWNLQVNAYPKSAQQEQKIRDQIKGTRYADPVMVHDMPDWRFRHLYVHFRASCDNCNGWGTVDASRGNHVHEWDWANGQNVGNCLNVYTCKTCGEKQTVDSSD